MRGRTNKIVDGGMESMKVRVEFKSYNELFHEIEFRIWNVNDNHNRIKRGLCHISLLMGAETYFKPSEGYGYILVSSSREEAEYLYKIWRYFLMQLVKPRPWAASETPSLGAGCDNGDGGGLRW